MDINNSFTSLVNLASVGVKGAASVASEIISASEIKQPTVACKQCLVMTALHFEDCRGVLPTSTAPSAASVAADGNPTTPEQKKCACYLGNHPEWVSPCSDLCPAEIFFLIEGKYTASRNENCVASAGHGADGAQTSKSTSANPKEEQKGQDTQKQRNQQQQKQSVGSTAAASHQRSNCARTVVGLALLAIGLQVVIG